MAILKDIVAYLCRNYPHKHELSKARLTKMVYLADWRSAIVNDRQITPIVWIVNHYGPYVEDVVDNVRHDPDFAVIQTSNAFGGDKELIRLIGNPSVSLDSGEMAILNTVIQATESKYWEEFLRLVYSTYPVLTQARYEPLNLVHLAREYTGRFGNINERKVI